MLKAPILLEKGSKVTVDLNSVLDRLPSKLLESLSTDPVGTVLDYKMTDGTSIGFVLELSDGSRHWFFEQELKISGSQTHSALIQPGQFNTKKSESALINFSGQHKFQNKSYQRPIEMSKRLIGLLNPAYFTQWLLYSLKDVF